VEQSVKEALRKQQITFGHALELAWLDKSLQKDLLKFCLFDDCGHRREFAAPLAQLRQYIARRVMLDLNLPQSELSTVKCICGEGEIYLHSTRLFLAIRFLSSTVFTSPLNYLPGMVTDLR
jgi:hypothetical protein